MRTWLTIAIACLLFADDLSAQVKLLSRRPTAVAATEPDDVPTLSIWLAADDASFSAFTNGQVVNTWQDKSGNGFNATNATDATCPIYTNNAINGKPAIRFDGVDNYIQFGPSASLLYSNIAGLSVFFVSRLFAIDESVAVIYAITKSDGGSKLDIRHSSGTAPWSYSVLGRRVDTDSASTSDSSKVASIPTLISILANHASQTLKSWSNSVASINDASWPASSGTTMSNAITKHVIGMQNTAYFYDGEIAEFIVYKSSLSDSDRATVETYLKSKYGL